MRILSKPVVFGVVALIALSMFWGVNNAQGQIPYATVAPERYPGYQAYPNQQVQAASPVYMASREMVPTDPTLGSENNAAAPEAKKENSFTAFFKKPFSSSKPKETDNRQEAPPFEAKASENKVASKPEKESKSSFSWWPSSKKKDYTQDDGQEQVERMDQEGRFTVDDYFESATASKNAAQKNLYRQGMQQESQGDFNAAVRSYNGFIKANKKQTDNGTLAAPYHRLALIAWRQNRHENADVYFRYGLRYAQGGNIPVIAGDYSVFLTEQGKIEQAETILRSTLLTFPNDRRLKVSLGHCLVRQDRPIEAMRYMKDALGEERACQEVAMIYQQRGEHTLAQSMLHRRDAVIARSGHATPYNLNPFNDGNPAPVQSATQPLAPPVLANPRGMQHKPTLAQPIPYPNLSDAKDPSKPGGATQISATVPEGTPVPTTGPVMPPGSNPTTAPTTPISKVYHYPSGSTKPVYHQYAGDYYPRTVAGVSPGKKGQNDYFMMSTVPTPVPYGAEGWMQPNPMEAATPTAPTGR